MIQLRLQLGFISSLPATQDHNIIIFSTLAYIAIIFVTLKIFRFNKDEVEY
jgi:hypothetical protein